MCAALSTSVTAVEDAGPVWPVVAARVQAYLEVAGLKTAAAHELAQEIVIGCATQRPTLAEDEAVLAALRVAPTAT